jgi:hypothetical protein
MSLRYLEKYTHRVTNVKQHREWLEKKGSKELDDWPGIGEHNCLFGAVLRGLHHAANGNALLGEFL